MLHSLPTKYRIVRDGPKGCLYCDEPDAPTQVWQAFNGAVPKGYRVCHTKGVTNCVNPEHLSIVSLPVTKPKKRELPPLEIGGKLMTYKEASAIDGVPADTIKYRMLSGMSAADAVRARPARRTEEYQGVTYTLPELAALGRVSYQTILVRLRRGWTAEQAVSGNGPTRQSDRGSTPAQVPAPSSSA